VGALFDWGCAPRTTLRLDGEAWRIRPESGSRLSPAGWHASCNFPCQRHALTNQVSVRVAQEPGSCAGGEVSGLR
jgi:hypothetical protein